MNGPGYWVRRLAVLPVLFLGIVSVSFFIIHLAPGGPLDARFEMNPRASLESKEKIRQLYGLDKPLSARFIDWGGRALRMDFGRSFVDGQDVSVKIARAIPVTLSINLLSLFLVMGIGIPVGVASALRRDRWTDRILSFLTLAGYSMPTFWLALVLVSFFSVSLRWLPVSGLVSFYFEDLTGWEKAVDLLKHLVLPVFVSALTGLAGLSRFVRSGMIEALRENYVRTARAKGLSESRVVFGHALRNALLPVVTILGLSVPGLLGGSVIFETIFSIPGMGRLFYGAVFARDYPVIMGVLVIGALLTLLGNLLADLGYRAVDPRVRLK